MKTGRVVICMLPWSSTWGEYKGRVLSLSLVPRHCQGLIVCQRHNYQCRTHSICPYMLHFTCCVCLWCSCRLWGMRQVANRPAAALPRHWRTAHHSRWVAAAREGGGHGCHMMAQTGPGWYSFWPGLCVSSAAQECICPMYLAEWSYACCHGVQPGVSTRDEYCPCPLSPAPA
jgi:hypothetical protein